jgi:gag-polyprotein putative aspartyl protease
MHVTLNQSRADLRQNGPKIRIAVGHPRADIEVAKREGKTLHPPQTVIAVIDTGASVSLIRPEVAATCGLRKTGPATVSVVGTTIEAAEHSASISFVDHELKGFDSLRVISSPLPRQEGVACLIGRDILERWRLYYDGTTGEMWIED